MKKLILILPFVLAACSQEPSAPQASADQQPAAQPQTVEQKPAAQTQAAAVKTGADKDEHGCIGSAGYTYSSVIEKCVRLWEDGIALAPVGAVESPSLAAYLVTSKDDKQVEVFIPNVKEGIVLNHATDPKDSSWGAPEWMLTYDAKQGWKLFRDHTLIYASKAQ